MDKPVFRYWLVASLLIAVIAVIELALTGADLQLWGKTSWRRWAFVYFSFEPWLLEGGVPFWPWQRVGMFLTYNFVHVGFWHMIGNLLVFAILTFLLRLQISLRAMLGICLFSAVGGALLYTLLNSPYPMTGASGALSGLMVAWALTISPEQGHSATRKVVVALVKIILLLALIEILPGGPTAWQTHLGGALSGAAATLAHQSWRRRGAKTQG